MRLLSRPKGWIVPVLAALTAVAGPPAPAHAAPARLHTSGTAIVDAAGRHVRLTGFNAGGMYEGAGNTPDACGVRWRELPGDMAANVQRWGFNSIRLHISWSNLEPDPPTVGPDGAVVHHWNTEYLQALDRFVAEAGRRHVYVIPVMTQAAVSSAYKLYDGRTCEGSGMPAWLFPDAAREEEWQGWCHFFGNTPAQGIPIRPLDGFVAAWRQIARRYANDPTVAALDLLNEPGSAFYPCLEKMGVSLQADYLDRFHARVGAAIREVSPKTMLVLEDSSYTEGPYGHFISSTAGLRNVVYEWHNYSPTWREVRPLLEAQMHFAQRIGAPIWLGEFAAFDAAMNDAQPTTPAWRSDLTAMMRFLSRHDVGWSMQNYDGGSSVVDPATGEGKSDLIGLLRQGTTTTTVQAAGLASAAPDSVGATPGSAWPCFSPEGFVCSYGRGVKARQTH